MVAVAKVSTGRVYEFDDFRLDPGARLLLRRGEPVALHGKAFEMLLALLENRGRLLTKDELFGLVWPDQIVEESNLTVTMSAIRKAIGERASSPRLITTVSGRGYRFTGEVREVPVEAGGELAGESAPFPPSVVERTQMAKSSSSARAVLLTLFGALALAAGAGVWFYQARGRDENQSAERATASHQPLTTRRFDTHGGLPVRVAISPNGESVAYIQRLKGKDSLWLGQVKTNSSVPVYQLPDLLLDPVTFSPDGSSLYFSVRGDRARAMLVRMPSLGGPLTELLPEVRGSITFSPDGRQMAFLRRDEEARATSLVLVDAADGKRERALATRRWPEDFSVGGPAWSPDGNSIAASGKMTDGREEILSFSVADGSVNKLGSRVWGAIENLVWLADGTGLLAMAKETAAELRVRQIWLLSHPGGAARQVTDDLNHFLLSDLSVSASGRMAFMQSRINSSIWVAPKGEPQRARLALQGITPRYEGVDGLAWTPSGRLLYTAYVGDSLVIWSADPNGADLRQLTPTKLHASDSYLSVSADGRLVVFQSNRSGTGEVWRVNADGSNLRQLTRGGDNTLPTLSPDGRWIVYVSERGGRRTLWRVSVEGGEPAQLTDYTALVPQVSPDGRSIAAFVSAQASPGYELAVIAFEGGQPVKRFPIPETVFQGRARMCWEPDGKSIIYKDDPKGLWRQALDGREPRQVEGFEEAHLRQLAWSFDGHTLAYTSGPATQEIILVENFR